MAPAWAALVAGALGVAACERPRDGGAAAALAIGELQVEAVVFDAEGRSRPNDDPIEPRLEAAIAASDTLRLARGAGGGARLRLRAQLSPDRAASELHALVGARVDRTGTILLSWETDRRGPLGPGAVEPSAGASRELLGAAIDEVVAALDQQAEVARRDDAGVLEALASGRPPARLAAARALGLRRPAGAAEPLCRALEGSAAQVSDGIVEALGQIGDERAVDCMAAWAGDEPARLGQAVKASTRIGGAKAVALLEKVAAREEAPGWLREEARGALAKFRPAPRAASPHGAGEAPAADDALIKALTHDEREVRIGAAAALAEAGRSDAVEPLCDLLDHPDPETAEAAVHSLAELRSARGVPCIVRWFTSDERRLPLAIEALAMIGGPEARTVLDLLAREHESQEVRDLARYAVTRIRPESRDEGH
jgi:HEAT repeat protein